VILDSVLPGSEPDGRSFRKFEPDRNLLAGKREIVGSRAGLRQELVERLELVQLIAVIIEELIEDQHAAMDQAPGKTGEHVARRAVDVATDMDYCERPRDALEERLQRILEQADDEFDILRHLGQPAFPVEIPPGEAIGQALETVEAVDLGVRPALCNEIGGNCLVDAEFQDRTRRPERERISEMGQPVVAVERFGMRALTKSAASFMARSWSSSRSASSGRDKPKVAWP